MHARAAEGSRDETGRLRLAARPRLLACADLDYPTAILPTSWMTAAGRRTLGRAELEKLLRDECRAARLSSRGAGAQDLP